MLLFDGGQCCAKVYLFIVSKDCYYYAFIMFHFVVKFIFPAGTTTYRNLPILPKSPYNLPKSPLYVE
jgi:hypothetical protein